MTNKRKKTDFINRHYLVEIVNRIAEFLKREGCGLSIAESCIGLVCLAVDIASKARVLSMGDKFEGGLENIKNEASLGALRFLGQALRICT